MTATVVAPHGQGERLQILETGHRLVRLGAGDQGWLREYHQILRTAAQDFLRRARLPGTGEMVCSELAELLDAGGAVWLVLDAQYRLLGFAAIRIGRAAFQDELIAEVPCAYLFPRRTPRQVFPVLTVTMREWARAQGATRLFFQTRRDEFAAFARTGAQPVGTLYEVELRGEETAPDG